ncbi:MAG: succinylglutamate desuccinylase/aspartoacylase family protein, partial [Myxococcota bacterium]
MSLLRTLLDQFAAARAPGAFAYEWHHHHDGGGHPLHVVIGAVVHGNEVGSLPALLELMTGLAEGSIKFGGKLTIFLGNPEASLADKRFLEADLNRVFIDDPPDNHEGRRARQVKPILAAADLFLDLHQTILETDRAFYIFPFSEESWLWARAMGA